jgi:hypothetical protein
MYYFIKEIKVPATYLIIETNEVHSSDYDYVDYLLDLEYNSSPSSLIDIPASEQELGDLAYYDALGSSILENAQTEKNIPLGKIVL